MVQTNNDCIFRVLISTNSPRQQRSLVGRSDSRPGYVLVHNFLRRRCNGSKRWGWLNWWMISDLRVLLEEFKHQIFEVLDAKIASALNRIIHNTRFKKKVSLEEQKAQKEDRILRGRHIEFLIYEYFRVTGANDSAYHYTDLFTIFLVNDDIQEFDSNWTEFHYQ